MLLFRRRGGLGPLRKSASGQERNMDRKIVEKETEDLVRPILVRNGMELVDVNFLLEAGHWVLRVFIDKPGGVNLEDCAFISHQIEDLIEVEDVIPQRYFLEVSSPGLDRVLKKESDFQRFGGEKARVKTREALAGGRRNFTGRIVRCEQGVLELEDMDGERFVFPLDRIEKARLDYSGKDLKQRGVPGKKCGKGRSDGRQKDGSGRGKTALR